MKKLLLKYCTLLLITCTIFLSFVSHAHAYTELYVYEDGEYEITYNIEISNEQLAAKGYTLESIEEVLKENESFYVDVYEEHDSCHIYLSEFSLDLSDAQLNADYDYNSWKDTLTLTISKDAVIEYFLSSFEMFTIDDLRDPNGGLGLQIIYPGEIYETNGYVDDSLIYMSYYDLSTMEDEYIEVHGSTEYYNTDLDSYDESETSFQSFTQSNAFIVLIIAGILILTFIIASAQVRAMKRKNASKQNRYSQTSMQRETYTPKSMKRQAMDRQKSNYRVEKKSVLSSIVQAFNEIKEQANKQMKGVDKQRRNTQSTHPYTTSNQNAKSPVNEAYRRKEKVVTPSFEATIKTQDTKVNTTTTLNRDFTSYNTYQTTSSSFVLNSNIAQEAPPAIEAPEAVAAPPAKAVDEE